MSSPFHMRETSGGNPLGFGLGTTYGEDATLSNSRAVRRVRKGASSPQLPPVVSPVRSVFEQERPLRRATVGPPTPIRLPDAAISRSHVPEHDEDVEVLVRRLLHECQVEAAAEIKMLKAEVTELRNGINEASRTSRISESFLRREVTDLRDAIAAAAQLSQRRDSAAAMSVSQMLDSVNSCNSRIDGLAAIVQQQYRDWQQAVTSSEGAFQQRLDALQRQMSDSIGAREEGGAPTKSPARLGRAHRAGGYDALDGETVDSTTASRVITKASLETALVALRGSVEADLERVRHETSLACASRLEACQEGMYRRLDEAQVSVGRRLDSLFGVASEGLSDVAQRVGGQQRQLQQLYEYAHENITLLRETVAREQEATRSMVDAVRESSGHKHNALASALVKGLQQEAQALDSAIAGTRSQFTAGTATMIRLHESAIDRLRQDMAVQLTRIQLEGEARAGSDPSSAAALAQLRVHSDTHVRQLAELETRLTGLISNPSDSTELLSRLTNVEQMLAEQAYTCNDVRAKQTELQEEVRTTAAEGLAFNANVDASLAALSESIARLCAAQRDSALAQEVSSGVDAKLSALTEGMAQTAAAIEHHAAEVARRMAQHETVVSEKATLHELGVAEQLAREANAAQDGDSSHEADRFDSLQMDICGVQEQLKELEEQFKSLPEKVTEANDRVQLSAAVAALQTQFDTHTATLAPEGMRVSGEALTDQLASHSATLAALGEQVEEQARTVEIHTQTIHALTAAALGSAASTTSLPSRPHGDLPTGTETDALVEQVAAKSIIARLDDRLDRHTEMLAETATQADVNAIHELLNSKASEINVQLQSVMEQMDQLADDLREHAFQVSDESTQRVVAAVGRELELTAHAINELSDYTEVSRCARFLVDTVADAYLAEMTLDIAQDVALQAVQQSAQAQAAATAPRRSNTSFEGGMYSLAAFSPGGPRLARINTGDAGAASPLRLGSRTPGDLGQVSDTGEGYGTGGGGKPSRTASGFSRGRNTKPPVHATAIE